MDWWSTFNGDTEYIVSSGTLEHTLPGHLKQK